MTETFRTFNVRKTIPGMFPMEGFLTLTKVETHNDTAVLACKSHHVDEQCLAKWLGNIPEADRQQIYAHIANGISRGNGVGEVDGYRWQDTTPEPKPSGVMN